MRIWNKWNKRKSKNTVKWNINWKKWSIGSFEILTRVYFKRSNRYEDEIELRIEARVVINEINILEEEVRNNEHVLLNDETKIDKLLTALKYEGKDIMNDIMI